jgi:predicted nucleic acid-binding protein
MWIAATALQHGLAVFSQDRHFHEVPGLLIGSRLADFIF